MFVLDDVDDVDIFSSSEKGRIDHANHVLPLLQDAGITVKLRTCYFFTETVDFSHHAAYSRRSKIYLPMKNAIKEDNSQGNVTK